MITRSKETIILESKLLPLLESKRLLKEGLIMTHPVDVAHRVLNRLGYNFDFVNDVFHRNFIKINGINVVTSLIDMEVDISDSEKFSNLLKTINSLGYFVSRIEPYGTQLELAKQRDILSFRKLYNELKDELFVIIIEAKYDLEVIVDTLPKTMFHITSKNAWSKIQKQGLSPKTKDKMAMHPDRVYLATSKQSAKNLMSMFSVVNPNDDHILLGIDISNMTAPRFRVFIDPNADEAVFTYSNIPPRNINLVT